MPAGLATRAEQRAPACTSTGLVAVFLHDDPSVPRYNDARRLETSMWTVTSTPRTGGITTPSSQERRLQVFSQRLLDRNTERFRFGTLPLHDTRLGSVHPNRHPGIPLLRTAFTEEHENANSNSASNRNHTGR